MGNKCGFESRLRRLRKVEMSKWKNKSECWHAIYGACIARQVFDWMNQGRGAPDNEIMKHFIEEAEAVADQAHEVDQENA